MASMFEQPLPEGFLDVFHVVTLPSTHPGAFIERGSRPGKAIHATTQQGFLSFGQYKEGYPAMPLQAIFRVLVDNNTADDSYILILDVYDHHSDRLIGKRLLTRKDFPKANDFCVFPFDFTPPSAQARMEFRIYYMGYSYVLADKIAVIDPTKVSLSHAESVLSTLKSPIILPEPWKVARIGNGDGQVSEYTILKEEINQRKGAFDYDGMFNIEGQGRIHGSRDDLFFLYQEWSPESGNGKIVAKFSELEGSAGVMYRETLDPDSAFIMMKDDKIFYRESRGRDIEEADLKGSGEIRGYKFIRKHWGSKQYFSGFAGEDPANATRKLKVKMTLSQHLYAGLAVENAKTRVEVGLSYKDVIT